MKVENTSNLVLDVMGTVVRPGDSVEIDDSLMEVYLSTRAGDWYASECLSVKVSDGQDAPKISEKERGNDSDQEEPDFDGMTKAELEALAEEFGYDIPVRWSVDRFRAAVVENYINGLD